MNMVSIPGHHRLIDPDDLARSGIFRLKYLTDRYGITSKEVLRATVLWGEMLDAINFPPGPCDNCKQPVVWDSQRCVYYHPGRPVTSDTHCLLKAGGTAERKNP